MPWRNIPPDIWQGSIQIAGLLLAGLAGSASRIAEQIANGDRRKVWGKELLVDITSFILMMLVALGVIEYYDLDGFKSVATTGVLCRAGTPLLDRLIKGAFFHFRGKP